MTPADPRERRRFDRRATGVILLWLAGFVLVGVRVGQLQTVEHEKLSRLAHDQYLNKVHVPARRGNIFDRNGKSLAIALEVPSVYANPSAIADPRQAARSLSAALDMKLDVVYQKLASDKNFVWLKRQVTQEVADKISALHLPGIAITKEAKRFYPNKSTAAHVLGFTGMDAQGLEGIEKELDENLKGTAQVVPAVRDAHGNAVLGGGLDADVRATGADVTLTIDSHIQHAAEEALAAALKESKATWGQAVVLDVQSAEVLALAVQPTFNPNQPDKVVADRRRNRAITDVFEPGSTLKPLVVAAALDARVVKPSMTFYCEKGVWNLPEFGKHAIRDSHPHEWLNVTQVIAKSSNIGAAKIGMLLGKERLDQGLRAFGLGRRTGVEFPGEAPGLLRDLKQWSATTLPTVSFGHGVAVTALQLAAAYRVLAAGGEYLAPRLVRKLHQSDGSTVTLDPPEAHSVIRPETARQMLRMMEAVVDEEGTGLRASVAGYRVAGKTGTAQKIDELTGSYSMERYMALFSGMLPAQDPRVVIVVSLDEPQGDHTGGLVAAPIFARIATVAMQTLGVLPTEEVSLADDETGEQQSAKVSVASERLPAIDTTTVKAGTVPSFMGLTVRQAVERSVELQLETELEMYGSGWVVKQEPSPGTKLSSVRSLQLFLGGAE